MKEIRIIIIVITLGIFSSGCVKEAAVPDLPPKASLAMEFDEIWATLPAPEAYTKITPPSNFIFAAASIYWWNAILTIQMAVPVAAFSESFNHDPVWDKSSTSWVWSYTLDFQNTSYTAELFAKSETDKINWSMYFSKEDGFTDFLWFSGTSSMDNTSGLWTINKDPDSNIKDPDKTTPYLEIEWNVSEDGIPDIKYTSIEAKSVNNGSYIHYGKISDPDYDAFYDIYRVWEENLVNIKWNTTSHKGRVLSMADYQNPSWHCWDESFKNIACE